MPSSSLCLDVKTSPENCPQLKKNMGSSALEQAIKVRKPYTITKQRERWTEEEHSKFLEALKLYGRAWRQIEEHVGTKTAVQIRSHAQKFFTKVVRGSTSDSQGEAKSIEIPPPRPKRKPMHPYPRKLGNLPSIPPAEAEQDWSLMSNLPAADQDKHNPSVPKLLLTDERDNMLPTSEQQNMSPTSVLSVVGSDTYACGSSPCELMNSCTSPVSSASGSDGVATSLVEQENGCQSASTSPEDDDKSLVLHNFHMELGCASDSIPGRNPSPVEVPMASLKLFGKTMIVADPQKQRSDPSSATFESLSKSEDMGRQVEEHNRDVMDGACSPLPFDEHRIQLNLWPAGVTPMFYVLPSHGNVQNSAETCTVSSPWMWAFYGDASPATAAPLNMVSEQEDRFTSCGESSNEGVRREISCADSNTVSASGSNTPAAKHCSLKLRRSETSAFRSLKATSSKPAKGFVPYKRCAPVPEKKVDTQRRGMMINGSGEGQGVQLCL